MKLSACLIVKNEEKMLGKTLPNLSKYADEIILVDTGSTDGTVAAAQKYGARIYHFNWINDFAAARNESIKHSTGDWILWIDADEFMTEEDLKALRQFLESSKNNAHDLTLYESKSGECEKKNGYRSVKVFRNGLGYYFVRPINEQLMDGSGKVVAGKEIPAAIYHWGQNLEAQRMDEKRRKYVELYSRALETNPSDPYLHFLLANKLSELQKLEAAAEHYGRCLEFSCDREVTRQALEKKATVLLRLKDLPGAARTAEELLKFDQQNITARNVIASVLLVSGKADAAIAVLTDALQIKVGGGPGNDDQALTLSNFLLEKATIVAKAKGLAR